MPREEETQEKRESHREKRERHRETRRLLEPLSLLSREGTRARVTHGTNRQINTEREEDVASRGVGDGGGE